LELVRHPDGPLPRFGSCYLVLRQHVSTTASFSFIGSSDHLGTLGKFQGVMSALLEEISLGGKTTVAWPPYRAATLGIADLTIATLLRDLRKLALPRHGVAAGQAGRVLDSGIEAQIHGPICLSEDAEILVADPSFARTSTGAVLCELARRYGLSLEWHRGFRLAVGDVPADFRGPAIPHLARRIASNDGQLDAAVVGRAAASLGRAPQTWQDYGTREDVFQHLKQLWHVLVHFGSPIL
jgi:hypothetical protein